MTNKFNLLVFFAVANIFMSFCSCKKNEAADFLTVETTQITFKPMVGSQEVRCSSNAKINTVSSQSWCTATVAGDGKTIVVRAEQNDVVSINVRTATITVTAGKAKDIRIEVKQLPQDAQFTVSVDAKLLFS